MSDSIQSKQWEKLRDEFQAARQAAAELRFQVGLRYDSAREGHDDWPSTEMLEGLGLAERVATQKWIELSAFVDAALCGK